MTLLSLSSLCCIDLFFVHLFVFLMLRRPPRSTRTDTSFPTRRSSDLTLPIDRPASSTAVPLNELSIAAPSGDNVYVAEATQWRSEEHTSELQSLMRTSYADFCLKKKIKKQEMEEQTKLIKQDTIQIRYKIGHEREIYYINNDTI